MTYRADVEAKREDRGLDATEDMSPVDWVREVASHEPPPFTPVEMQLLSRLHNSLVDPASAAQELARVRSLQATQQRARATTLSLRLVAIAIAAMIVTAVVATLL